MKRLISLTLALILCLGFTLQSFAAVSLNENQIYVSGTGAYVFGSFDVNEAITEVGVKVNGKNYPADSLKSYQMMKNGKFGMGFNDPEALLGSSYEVTPYYVTASGEVTGEAVTVRREIINTVTDVTVGGKSVAGFYRGTSETDFYYGMDSLPETAAELPAVSVESGKTVLELETEVEYGGYVTTASLKGVEILRVHFREFVEITHTVRPEQFVSVYYNRASATDAMLDVPANTGSGFNTMYMGIETYGDETSEENKLLYAIYDVPAVEDYAPVYYELAGLRAKFTPFSIYNYDGDLTSKTFPITNDDEGNVNEFVHYEGLNTTDEAFKLVDIGSEIDSSNNVIDTEAVIASSPTVKEGKNILIYKASGDILEIDGADYQTRVDYVAYAPAKQMAITVKYVEKNPTDPTLTDTGINAVKIDGKACELHYDEATKAYYVPVENYEEFNVSDVEITAEANVADAVITKVVPDEDYNQVLVSVTAGDGITTGENIVVFKEVCSKVFAWKSLSALYYSNGTYKRSDYATRNYMRGKYNTENLEYTDNMVTYAGFSVAELSNAAIVGNAVLSGVPTRKNVYTFYNTEYPEITAKCTFGEIINGTADVLATYTCEANYLTDVVNLEFPSSLLNITEDKNIYIGLTSEPNNTAVALFESPALKVNYIKFESNEDVNQNNTAISSVLINDENAVYYDSSTKTYYAAVEAPLSDFDFNNCEITVIPESAGATAEAFTDGENAIAEIEVTAKDGVTIEQYKVVFKEIKQKEIAPSSITLLQYYFSSSSGIFKYQTGSRTSEKGMKAQTPLGGLNQQTDTSTEGNSEMSYAAFPVSGLSGCVLVGEAVFSGTASYKGTHTIFATEYETITIYCNFDEIKNNTAKILGRAVTTAGNEALSVSFDFSDVSANSEGNIMIGLYDEDGGSSSIIKNPILTVKYIEID